MDYIEKGKWMLEALENTHDEQLKIDLLYMSICCGKLALTTSSKTKQAVADSLKDLLTLEPQFEQLILAAAADSGRISSPSLCGESYYKIENVPDGRVEASAPFVNNLSHRRYSTQYASGHINVKEGALPSQKSSAVRHKDLLSFERTFREHFRALKLMLGSLSPPPKQEVEKIQEIEKEDGDTSATSARHIDVLKNRQQQLETIIDVLVTRLEQERKEKVYLLQKLVGCNEK
jgi:hypothetical protein